MMRLHDSMEGKILINGDDIKGYDYGEYLFVFASVFQDYKLFAFIIGENIGSFESGNHEKVREVAHKFRIGGKVM